MFLDIKTDFRFVHHGLKARTIKKLHKFKKFYRVQGRTFFNF